MPEEKPLPVQEVRAMVQQGFSERDIIRQLKARGYTFSEIEGAIMAAVKEGVQPGIQPQPAGPQPEEFPMPVPMPLPAEAGPPGPPVPGKRMRMAYEPSGELAPLPPPPPVAEEAPPPEEQEQYVEDIVESVLEEKFEKFMFEAKAMKEELEELRTQVQELRQRKPEAAEVPAEFASRMDELEARVGGLEKAFRQYLPALAESIQRLSGMMKREA